MPTLDDIKLDKSNREFNYAANLVENSNQLIYLTGKAGTGKTTFLKYIKETTSKKTVVLAPTGVAALNAGGQTIHSFFRIAPSLYLPEDIRLRTESDPEIEDQRTIFDHFKYRKEQLKLIREMELLIIDEVSMMRCDLLDLVDRLLRVFRDRQDEVFGGVQVVLIGDAFQLPPIVKDAEWKIMNFYYETPFFFSSKVLTENEFTYIELKKIYRQKDAKFIDLLNRIRLNTVTENEIHNLNTRFIPAIVKNDNLNHIIIATHNTIVDQTNERKLMEITSPLLTYEAEVTDGFSESMMPTEKILRLKEGAQVMFIRNDPERKYYNGKIARIKELTDRKIIVRMDDGNEIEVKKYTWSNIKYKWDSSSKKIIEEKAGEFTQYPIKLAWAVTVHKCQGLTFDNIIADLRDSFAPGQVYVALSRCTSLEGLVLKSTLNRNVIKTDPHVLKFAERETRV